MTTEKLIELAKYCIGQNPNNHISCKDCPYKKCDLCKEMLLSEVAKRLEKAYEDLKDLSRCSTCGNSLKCIVGRRHDTEYCLNGEWEWEGDKE